MTATSSSQCASQVTYASAGVDVEAGDKAVELMKASVAKTFGANVVGGIGGFAGLVDVSELRNYKRPLLATSTDGVGTKVALAQALDIHDTIGQDLVGMVVDDIVVVGAKPLLMTDYIACGHVVPERIADIVRGVAEACASINVPLLGGETAEHPGLLAPDEYDVAGAATGVVEAEKMLGPERVKPGDVLIGLAASGLHSNGYSLVRRVLEVSGAKLDQHIDDFGRTLGEELLEPTRLYTNICLQMVSKLGENVRAFSHVTGGGLGANLARVLPAATRAIVSRDSWQVPPVFQLIARLGQVPWSDLERTLNLGVGMVAVVSADSVDAALEMGRQAGMSPFILGDVMALNDPDKSVSGNDQAILISGAKGVQGGVVELIGSYR